MPDIPLTPEEKLLRIIESPPGAARGMRMKRRGFDFKSSLALFKAKYAERLKGFFNLKTVNSALIFFAVGGTVLLALDFSLGMPRVSAIARLEESAKKMELGDLSIERLEPLAVYVQEIGQRNIFALAAPPPPETPAQKTEPKVPAGQSLIAGLKVVGIIWSATPQAIVEDSKEGRTYLLNRGGKIRDAKVKEILKDRVILSYDNKDIELR